MAELLSGIMSLGFTLPKQKSLGSLYKIRGVEKVDP